MTETHRTAPRRVVVVGGGIAALEAVLALHRLAEGRLDLTLVAPEDELVLRPLTVTHPFARGGVEPLPLTDVMTEHSGTFVRGTVRALDAGAREVVLADGSRLSYDTLLLAPGAIAVPAFDHVTTFGHDPDAIGGILRDLEEGYSRSVAFVVHRGIGWPLPIYELALMTAEQVRGMGVDQAQIHLVTPETAPLDVFGREASTEVASLLDAAGITLHSGVTVRILPGGRIETGFSPDLVVDRVVALPELHGPEIDGLPTNDRGFVEVDDVGRVRGLDDVYAVGDVTARPVKQGGLACQQADVAAAHIAAEAGAQIEVPPLPQVLRGRLLTGGEDRFLRREPGDLHGEAAGEPLWWPPAKVSGRHLTPYLEEKGIIRLPLRAPATPPGIDVGLPLDER